MLVQHVYRKTLNILIRVLFEKWSFMIIYFLHNYILELNKNHISLSLSFSYPLSIYICLHLHLCSSLLCMYPSLVPLPSLCTPPSHLFISFSDTHTHTHKTTLPNFSFSFLCPLIDTSKSSIFFRSEI